MIEKSIKLSFWLIGVLNVVGFSLKTAVDSVCSNSRGSFFEASKSLGFTKMALDLLFLELSSVELNNGRSDFFALFFNLHFMLFIDIFDVYLFIFIGAFFVVRKS